jgi:hypothetical protein
MKIWQAIKAMGRRIVEAEEQQDPAMVREGDEIRIQPDEEGEPEFSVEDRAHEEDGGPSWFLRKPRRTVRVNPDEVREQARAEQRTGDWYVDELTRMGV